MKKITFKLLIAIIAFTFFYFNGCESNDNPQDPVFNPPAEGKKVLFEFFTNSGCIPCVPAHGYLDQIAALSGVTSNDTNIIIISYHAKYPYIQDSLYRANTLHNDGRSTFYEVFFTPQGRVNGANAGAFSVSGWTDKFNTELSQPVYLNIGMEKTFDPAADTGTVFAYILPQSELSTGDNVLHIILTESNIPYVTAPNGITQPDDVMRNMINGIEGEPITLSQGQTKTITKQFTLNSNWNEDECYLTVFVQSTSTKQIYGVERIKVK